MLCIVHSIDVNNCRDASSGVINGLEAKLALSDTDYKNTPKVTWLAETDHAPFTPTVCVIFDHLISKGVLKPEDNFKDFVNYNSKVRLSGGHVKVTGCRGQKVQHACNKKLFLLISQGSNSSFPHGSQISQ